MSRMNAAWSNSEQWTEAIPEIFKQPMTIAFGGAVLAHAIFFLGLPVVAGKDNQPNIADTPLVELRPQDLSQIPPDATQSNQIPPNFSQSKLPTGTLLPGSTGLLTPSILSPSIPSPLDSGSPFTSGINSGSSSGSSSSSNIYPGITSFGNSGNNSSLKADSERKVEVDKKAAADKEIKDKQVTDDRKRLSNPIDSLPPTTPTPPGVETEKPAPIAAQPTTSPSPKVLAKSNEEIIAANPKSYTFNLNQPQPTQTTQLIAWATLREEKKLGVKFPKDLADIINTPDKKLPYPKEVQKQPVAPIPDYIEKLKLGYGTAIIAISVDSKGVVADGRTIIQSTGYPILDEYAIEYVNQYVKSRPFPATSGDQYYLMTIPIAPPIVPPATPPPVS